MNQTIVPYMVDPDAARSVAIWADNTGSDMQYTVPVVRTRSIPHALQACAKVGGMPTSL